MNAFLDDVFLSWPFSPWLLFSLVIPALIYVRGWRQLRKQQPFRWTSGKLAFFVSSVLSIYLALGSPIETFSGLLLQVHMIQHMLLMLVAPPLFWLSDPMIPMLRGMPTPFRREFIIPLFQDSLVIAFFQKISHPINALLFLTVTTWVWHIPIFYNAALQSDLIHYFQHVCFLLSGIFFWYAIIRPYPSHPKWSKWLLLPALLLADIQNTILCGIFSFSDKVLYSHYESVPRIMNLSAIEDQAIAGVVMWVPGSLAFLLPLCFIGIKLLYGSINTEAHSRSLIPSRLSLPLVQDQKVSGRITSSSFDILKTPLLGNFLRWRYSRFIAQTITASIAFFIIYDGLFGPQIAPMNIAGVLPWIHWRAIIIMSLLLLANAFCFGCPFMVPRTISRMFFSPSWRWPRALRNKWLAIILLLLFFWSYEAFSLWDSPMLTAWIIILYFTAAFIVDSLFRDASFCKYLCPIGQFQFVYSMASPFEIAAKETLTCQQCSTKDCIRGNEKSRGCELKLFIPNKVGNLDCTMCLDCLHACPQDNIAIQIRFPMTEFSAEQNRSGIGRLSKRGDIAIMILVLTFAAFANAAGMVGPVLEWQDELASRLGLSNRFLIVSLFYLFSLIFTPAIVTTLAAFFSNRSSTRRVSIVENLCHFALTFVPIGLSMWLVHYCFHFVTSYQTIVPAVQHFFQDRGLSFLGEANWICSCCGPMPSWLLPTEIIALDLGLLLSLYICWRCASSITSRARDALSAAIPWATVHIMLFLIGVWILFQPMQMRGTLE